MKYFYPFRSNRFFYNYTSKYLFLILLFVTANSQSGFAQTILPKHYWTFNGPNVETDSMSNGNLDFVAFNSPYTWGNNGQVGKFVTLDQQSGAVDAASILLDSTLTIEFLFKPGPDFNTTTFFLRRDNAFKVKFDFPFINFQTVYNTSQGVVNDEFLIHLTGVGRKAYGYYVDGNWHHMVFKFNTNTGIKEVWVDGQLPNGFTKNVPTGSFSNGDPGMLLNHAVNYRRYFGAIDEIAIYDKEIPATMIYKHYLDAQQGLPYSFVNNSSIIVPAADPVATGIDPVEYPIGHPNAVNNMVKQLTHFPTPRFASNHTFQSNFQWINPKYFGGLKQANVSKQQAIYNSVEIQKELAENYNYSVLVNNNTKDFSTYDDSTDFHYHWVKLANDNPQWKASAITFWGQTVPTDAGFSSPTSYILSNNMPANHYVINAYGQYMDNNGAATLNPGWNPSAPLDSFLQDGLTQRFYFQELLSEMTRPLDYINENGEVTPLYKVNAISQDANAVADKIASGLNWNEYQALRKTQISIQYKDAFMSLPGLANTKFSEYYISGNDDYLHLYDYTRTINTTINNQKYNTLGFYPRWPENWRYWIASWAGWQWVVENRQKEIPLGDKFYSPFVGSGWNIDPEINCRPAQYLGLLKCVGMTGADFYHASIFIEDTVPPFINPDNYAWQAVMPSYSQATSSWYSDIFWNGHLMDGDVPDVYFNPTGPGYSFASGDQRVLVVARKHDVINKYAITGTIQPHSNMLNSAEKVTTAKITIDANDLQFEVRRQGSTYVFDNSNTSSPIFYQVDKWHENSHPERWSTDFELEAELFQSSSNGASRVTEVPTGTLQGDYRDYTTYIASSASDSISYSFTNRINAEYYLWIRARNTTGVSKVIHVILDNGSVQTVTCVDDTAWNWYTIKGCSVESLNGLSLSRGGHNLTLVLPDNTIHLDKILVTKEKFPVLEPGNSICDGSYLDIQNTLSTATELVITKSKQNISCNGLANGTISINVDGGAPPYKFEWSTSPVKTTSSLQNLTSGIYTVTVTDNDFCSKKSTIEIKEPSSLIAFFLPNHPTTPNTGTGSIDQLVAGGVGPYTFNWFPILAITEDLVAVPAGTYYATTIDANGCAILNATTLIDPPAIYGGNSNSKNAEITNLINVYPNPFDDILNIYLESNATTDVLLRIRDISGRTVYEIKENFKSIYSISISQLNAGLYFLEVQQGEKMNRTKIIKSE